MCGALYGLTPEALTVTEIAGSTPAGSNLSIFSPSLQDRIFYQFFFSVFWAEFDPFLLAESGEVREIFGPYFEFQCVKGLFTLIN
jgi:hypothetical protein